MAFTEQDDTGLIADANAYISLVEMRAYHLDRGLDLSAVADGDLEAAIVRATDYIDQRFPFIGLILNNYPSQTTEWPRKQAFWPDGGIISGLPTPLKEACAEYANVAQTETLYQPSTTLGVVGVVKKKDQSVDVLKDVTEYFESGSGASTLREIPIADNKLYAAGLVEFPTDSVVRGA